MVTLLVMWVTIPVGAQELEQGTWTGTLTPPPGGEVPVTFEVGGTDGALSIVMTAPLVEPPMVFNDVKLDGDELTFWWAPDIRLDCRLLRKEDGSFEGPCSDGSGPAGEGILKMLPPSGN
tara:strand:- start:127 stop:486 length:360 start_codon:yes stop_codon:yes gene_type:complete